MLSLGKELIKITLSKISVKYNLFQREAYDPVSFLQYYLLNIILTQELELELKLEVYKFLT